MGHPHGSVAKRLARHTDRHGPVFPGHGRCWVWTSYCNRLGYGRINIERRNSSAAKATWELVSGPMPPGLEPDHLCRNRACVRPSHLEPVTHAENARRANAAVTHCPRGHAYDKANTYISKKGERKCRSCNRQRAAAYYATRRSIT